MTNKRLLEDVTSFTVPKIYNIIIYMSVNCFNLIFLHKLFPNIARLFTKSGFAHLFTCILSKLEPN